MDPNDDVLFDVTPSTERRCHVCHVVRPLAMFYVASEQRETAKAGRPIRRRCRVCQQRVNADHRAPRAAIIAKIKTEVGCADCGHRDDAHPEVFEFDHLPGAVKVQGIAAYLTKGTLEEMLAEIAKCEVVCANCHRIRTYSRQHGSFGRDRGPEPSADALRKRHKSRPA